MGRYTLLGESVDDAAGEAFDKSAKLLGLDYPGGASLSQLAQSGTPGRFKLPRPMLHSGDLDFSFSGLKTAVLTLTQQHELDDQTRADVAHAAQDAIVDVLATKALSALGQTGLDQLVVAGGVGANHIAKWNGTSWSALGSGRGGGSYYGTPVSALGVWGRDVYAGTLVSSDPRQHHRSFEKSHFF